METALRPDLGSGSSVPSHGTYVNLTRELTTWGLARSRRLSYVFSPLSEL